MVLARGANVTVLRMIHDAIYERAVEDLAGRVRALRQGCSVPGSAVAEDCGAMSMPAQV